MTQCKINKTSIVRSPSKGREDDLWTRAPEGRYEYKHVRQSRGSEQQKRGNKRRDSRKKGEKKEGRAHARESVKKQVRLYSHAHEYLVEERERERERESRFILPSFYLAAERPRMSH